MVFSLLETSLLLFFLFLTEINLQEQHIQFTSPLRPIKEVFSFVYMFVAILRSLFKGIVVFTKNQNHTFGYSVGVLARIFIILVLHILTQAVGLNWELILSFLWLFFSLICGLTFVNLVNLLGVVCLSTCNKKLHSSILPLLGTTLFCTGNTIYSFTILYMLTEDKLFSFDSVVIGLLKYILVHKIFNSIVLYYFYDQILKFLSKYYEQGYFNPFINDVNIIELPEITEQTENT